ncbi:hypothetical protein [Alkalimarinus alittae]|uniref:Uncharacterized protein n=1 Tax=Alkalimarinus alittae TaxID=2961619 RepID=A0ABY6N4B8_9ALTE|nr:hypothetical protein [Alkalimarinus alittae]UZE96814.1 hypothetical protein NKI27_03415 [Alkalimarinus alittae]
MEIEIELNDDWYLTGVKVGAKDYWLSYSSNNRLIREASKVTFEHLETDLSAIKIGSITIKESTLECARNGQRSAIGALIKRGLNQLIPEQEKLMLPEIRKLLIRQIIPQAEIDLQIMKPEVTRAYHRLASTKEKCQDSEFIEYRINHVKQFWRGPMAIVTTVDPDLAKRPSVEPVVPFMDIPEDDLFGGMQIGCCKPEVVIPPVSPSGEQIPCGFPEDRVVFVKNKRDGLFISWLFTTSHSICGVSHHYVSLNLFWDMINVTKQYLNDESGFDRMAYAEEILRLAEEYLNRICEDIRFELTHELKEAKSWGNVIRQPCKVW